MHSSAKRLLSSECVYMENRWSEIDRGIQIALRKNLTQSHFFHHKSHMDRPGIEPGIPGANVGANHLNRGTAFDIQ